MSHTRPRQIDSLTGVRGFASLWVLFHHLPSVQGVGAVWPAWFLTFSDKGWLGVDLFFILSGFVISLVHQAEFSQFSPNRIKRFLLLRLARVYPAHLVTTAILIPIYLAAHILFQYVSPKDAFAWSKLALSLLLIHGWGLPDSEGWNLPSWSVSSEWFAYLFFPFASPLIVRFRSILSATLGVFSIMAVLYFLAFTLGGGTKFILPWKYALVRVTSEFAIGCLLFNIFQLVHPSTSADRAAMISLLGVCLLPFLAPALIFDGLYLFLFSGLLLGLSLGIGPITTLFASTPMVYLGKVSYSLYLIHGIVLMVANQIVKRALPHPTSGQTWIVIAVALALSILLADLIFRWVEDPCRKRFKVWMDRQAPVAQPATQLTNSPSLSPRP